jgi:bacillithiol system protein YtxJ
MGLFSLGQKKKSLNWIEIKEVGSLDSIFNGNDGKPALLFKHSTRCSISSMALSRFESEWDLSPEKCDLYYIDLIAYRPVSNAIAERSNVVHQSPQAILVIDGKVQYHNSHNGISATDIAQVILKVDQL